MKTEFIQGSNNSPVLSILICSLEERKEKFLERILNILNPQIKDKDVEIVILTDKSEIPIGTKRNMAMDMSAGKYICFVDDDDIVTEDYVDLILEKIKENSDVIAITGIMTTNGDNPKLFKNGIEYEHGEIDNIYYRRPNHLSVHRKENIGQRFLDVRTGEDDEWAARRLSEIKSQSKIEKVIYHYDYRSDTKKYFIDPIEMAFNTVENILGIEILRPSDRDLEGKITINVLDPDVGGHFFNFPLHFTVTDFFGKSVWETSLDRGWFSSWIWIPWTKSKIIDSSGNLVWSWSWDPIKDGCVCHQIFHLWSLKNRGAFGIAIGTHDGTSGEWVGSVNDGTLKALLIEASDANFEKLKQNYQGKGWIRIENKMITSEGGERSFYEGGSGHTNSALISHTQMTVDPNEIRETVKQSQSLISLLEQNPGARWLHIDVEGIDDELILSLEGRDDLLPDVIVYEHESLTPERENKLVQFLNKKGFILYKAKSRNSIAIK